MNRITVSPLQSSAMLAADTHVSTCTRLRQFSRSPCVYNQSFGCDTDHTVWVSAGCRGEFRLPAVPRLLCGFAGARGAGAPRSKVRLVCNGSVTQSVDRDCSCQTAGRLQSGAPSIPGPAYCAPPSIDAKWACSGGGGGGPFTTCCAASGPASDVCEPGWSRCRWRGEQRIGWLHMPKCGTSFLGALAHLANGSLPAQAVVPRATKRTVEWEDFFRQWPAQKWFRGSAIFWGAGMAHSALSAADYDEFHGRLFAMFRDPRQRGWSAYRFFTWDLKQKQHTATPQQYAKCIAGTQTLMLTGEASTAPYGAVCLHLVAGLNGTCQRGRRGCPRPPDRPNMALAQRRLQEGFAFVGLTEEWPLSMCLFVGMAGARSYIIPRLRLSGSLWVVVARGRGSSAPCLPVALPTPIAYPVPGCVSN